MESNTPAARHNLGSRAQHGDVDEHGQIVDRFRRAVGPDRSVDVVVDEQVGLALELLERARRAREAAAW